MLSALLLSACGEGGAVASEAERSALLVRVASVSVEDRYEVRREYVGRVEARRQAQVGFELGGELALVAVDDGDRVAKGQRLARLDTARLEARRAEALAALEQARSAAQYAERNRERNETAAEFEGVSAQELDLAIDRANAATAGLAAAEARLETVEVDIAKSDLRAPFDAVVVKRRLDEGQIVAAGQPILDVQEAAAPEVRIGIAGDLSRAISPGDVYTMRIDDREIEATVRAVVPLRDATTRTVDVVFKLDDESRVLPGDLARLELEQPVLEQGVWLPIGALAEGSRGLWTAYVAIEAEEGSVPDSGATHYLEPRAVEVLHQDSGSAYVRGALEHGELYVTGGLPRVVPNQQVRIDMQVATGTPEASER